MLNLIFSGHVSGVATRCLSLVDVIKVLVHLYQYSGKVDERHLVIIDVPFIQPAIDEVIYCIFVDSSCL